MRAIESVMINYCQQVTRQCKQYQTINMRIVGDAHQIFKISKIHSNTLGNMERIENTKKNLSENNSKILYMENIA